MSLNNETPPPPVYREISADLQAKMNLIIQSEATVADGAAFAQIKELMQAIVDSPPASPSWQVDDLREQLAASRRTIDVQSTFHGAPKPSRGDKIPDPPKFSGTRDELDGFLAQLCLKLYSDESRFSTPSLRMAYTFNRLEGRTQEQVLPYVKNNEINLTDTEDIIQILKNAFGDPDPAATARSKLYNLKQGKRDFAVYYAEFQGLVAKLGWDTRARHDALSEGLSIELHQQLLGREKGLSYEQFVALCQELDVGLRALHHREGKHSGGTAQRNHQNHLQPRIQTTTPTNYTAPSSGTQSPHPDAIIWTSVLLVAVEKSPNKKKQPGSGKVAAFTVEGLDTWLATAPTSRRTPFAPPLLTWRRIPMHPQTRVPTRLRTRTRLRSLSTAVVGEEIGEELGE